MTTNYTISLIDFTNEEGARPSLLGFELTSGVFEKEYVYSRRDKDNITFEKALIDSGFMEDKNNRLVYNKLEYYLKFHIEQGSILYVRRKDIK
jgi:N-carbamoyl-L-amino-acid hydrolase